MSNIDELLIDANLKERPTTDLPWDNKYGEEKNVKQDEETFREYNDARPSRHEKDIARYMSINRQNETVKVSSSHVYRDNVSIKYYSSTGLTGHNASYQRDSQDETSSMWKGIDKLERYEPSFGASRLPGSVKVFNAKGFDKKAILPASPCTRVPNSVSSLKDSTQEEVLTKSKRNTTTSVKVSRHVIQEAKLGYQAPLRSEIATQTEVDKPKKSADAPLINKDTNDHKSVTTQTMSNSKQSVISQSHRNKQFNMVIGTSMQRTGPKRFSATRRQDIVKEVNELNDLLDVTADAMNMDSFKNKARMESSMRMNRVLTKGQLTNTGRSKGELVKCDQKSSLSTSIGKQSNSYTVGNEYQNHKTTYKGRKEAGSKSHIVELKQDDEHSVSSDSFSISSDRSTKPHKSTKGDVEEDPCEILQFVCQMMDIKQPKLMSRKKKCASPASTQNQENDKIDYAKVEEQNKKSEELFWKKIREGKKKKNKKPTIIHVVPEPNKVRVRKTKEKVEKQKSFTVVNADARSSVHRLAVPSKMVESEDDLFDIAPVKDRKDFSDSGAADSLNQDIHRETNKDRDFVEKESVNEACVVKPAKSYTVMKHEQGSRFTVTNSVTRSISSLKQSKTKNKRKKENVTTVTPGEDRSEREANNNTKNQACKIISRLSSDGKAKVDIETKSYAGQSPLTDRSDNDTNVKYEQHTDTRENFVNKTRNVTPVTDLADIMYTSEDTHTDSDYSSCGDYFSRSATAQSRALPRPASNTTYILNTNDDDSPHPDPENDAVPVTEESNINNGIENKRVEKLNRVHRFWRWLTCCVRPKSDD